MLTIKLMLVLLLPLALGYCVIAVIAQNKLKFTFLERASMAWCLGIGLIGIKMFMLSLLNIPLSFQIIAIPVIIIIAIFIPYIFLKKLCFFDLEGLKQLWFSLIKKQQNQWEFIAEKLLILLIGIKILYVFFDALIKPISMIEFDALWRQGCIARIIFSSGTPLTQQSIALAGPHPFLNPLSQAWIYLGIGTWNDAIGKIIFPILFCALLFVFYAQLRKYASRLYSLVFTYFLSTFPLIVFHAGTAYSDLMQTTYYAIGILLLWQWMESRKTPAIYLSALFFGIGNFVKQSGIPLWGLAGLALFIYIFVENKKAFKTGISFVLVSGIISAPWLFYQNSFLMRQMTGLHAKLSAIFGGAAVTGAEITSSPIVGQNMPSLINIMFHMGRRMFTYADWQILWFAFILALIFGAKQIWKSNLKYLFLVIILDIGMLVYAFFDPGTYKFVVDGTLVNRAIMYQIPVVLFFVAVCFQEMLKPADN